MFENWIDVLLYAAAGATGGFIYWAARTHGQVFTALWAMIYKP
jgi:hypothetical protein